MTINIQFGEKTVRVAVEINGAIESAMTYLPEREWIGLTEDEVALIAADCSLVTPSDFYFAQAIEAKLKERNT